MDVKCITIKDGYGTYYIPLKYIKTLVLTPVIQTVPQADEHIAGISYYDGEIVTYYWLGAGNINRTTAVVEGKIACGIILRKDKYCLGICATEISDEIVLSEEELENQNNEIFEKWRSDTYVNNYDQDKEERV